MIMREQGYTQIWKGYIGDECQSTILKILNTFLLQQKYPQIHMAIKTMKIRFIIDYVICKQNIINNAQNINACRDCNYGKDQLFVERNRSFSHI